MMRRRTFLRSSTIGVGGLAVGGFSESIGKERAEQLVMTVTGPISTDEMGFTLPHEHILVDFIGADKVGPDRYDADQAFDVVLPHLRQAVELGCRTLVECTPSYIGRDAGLCLRLSEATGLKILTNTGYYGAANDKYVPGHAYVESADELAARWTREWDEGIDGTSVRPGFIKIGVDKGPLSEIDQKLVQAAARAHLRTGLLILSHTGYGEPAQEQIAMLKAEGVHPSAWVWTHAQNEPDNDQHEKAASEGAWIAFDGLSQKSSQLHLNHLLEMKKRGYLGQVHLSQDAGWYRPGEPRGGHYRPYDFIFSEFLPVMKTAGLTNTDIRTITAENPRRSFRIGVRQI